LLNCKFDLSPRLNWATQFFDGGTRRWCSPDVSVRMAWISFGVLPCRGKKTLTARVSMLLKSRASPDVLPFRLCKELSAPPLIIFGFLKMSEGQADGELNVSKNKDCRILREEWLLQLVETELPSTHQKLRSNTWRYSYISRSWRQCMHQLYKRNLGAGPGVEKWRQNVKLDHSRRHLNLTIHVGAVNKWRNQKNGGILRMLIETPKKRDAKVVQVARKKSDYNMVKVLIVKYLDN